MIEIHVVNRIQPQGQELFRHEQVPEVRSGEGPARITAAIGVERPRVLPVLGVLDHQPALRGEQTPVARVAGRHDAIEQVHPGQDPPHKVLGRAEPHQVPGLLLREKGQGVLGHLVHQPLGLSQTQATNGVSGEIQGDQVLGAALPLPGKHAALNDPEDRPVAGMRLPAPPRPFGRQRDGPPRAVVAGGVRHRVVQGHPDVRSEHLLYLDDLFGREPVSASVQVGLELDPLFGDPREALEAEGLKAPAVGQDGPVPLHKAVKPPLRANHLVARPKVEVVGVGHDDLRADFPKLVRGEGFDRGLGSDGHEGRRLHRTVGGQQLAGPGLPAGGSRFNLKGKTQRRRDPLGPLKSPRWGLRRCP